MKEKEMDDKYNYIRPTHRCSICGAYWKLWEDSWSLTSSECGKCCDQEEMGGQIKELEEHKTNTGEKE